MKLKIAQYARNHDISLRTAYRHIHIKRTVADGDSIVKRGRKTLVDCIHGQDDGKSVNDRAISRRKDQEPTAETSLSPLDQLVQTISREGISDANEIRQMIEAWEALSAPVKTALSQIELALRDFVTQNRTRELSLRERVLAEGAKRQRSGKGGCSRFDEQQVRCSLFRVRKTGVLFQPTKVDCALCPHFLRVP